MPIFNIEIVSFAREQQEAALAGIIADKAGDIFSSVPGRTWVKIRWLSAEQYAENGGGPPENVRPVFVEILLSELPNPEEMKRQINLLTETISQLCNRPPENVHILYQPAAKGRMAFGGRIDS